jgi:hypothetical protein
VITKAVTTAIMLMLDVRRVLVGRKGVARMLNFVDVLFMLFTGIVWFKWDLVQDAFRERRTSYQFFGQRKVRSEFPINRFGSKEIRGMIISRQPRSASSDRWRQRTVRPLHRAPICAIANTPANKPRARARLT